VDVRIGVTYSPKEIEVQLGDDADSSAVRADIDKAIAEGSTLWLTDRKGRQVGIPVERLAYVEISASDRHKIGFGS
jgi:hypothetical protein